MWDLLHVLASPNDYVVIIRDGEITVSPAETQLSGPKSRRAASGKGCRARPLRALPSLAAEKHEGKIKC